LSGPDGRSKAIQKNVRLIPNNNRSVTNRNGWIMPDLLAHEADTLLLALNRHCRHDAQQLRLSERPAKAQQFRSDIVTNLIKTSLLIDP
jgi:hypothetical protein